MSKPPKPDPYLTAYLNTLNGLFNLWRAAAGPIQRGIIDDADDATILPHLDYLTHVRQAVMTIPAPAGGEEAQRALLTAMQSSIDRYYAILATDDESSARSDQHSLDLLEDYTAFNVAIERLAVQAQRYEY